MKTMTYEDQKMSLRTKAEELSHRIAGGDAETMQMMDEWYDTLRNLEHFCEHKSLIAINGKDLPLGGDLINKECVILITKDIHKKANDSLRHDYE